MAAYEKKRQGFFGKFSGFPDDNSKSPREQSSGKPSCVVLFLEECQPSIIQAIHGSKKSSRR